MSDILRSPFRLLLSLLLVLDASAREPIPAPTKTVRARDLGIPFDGTPGKFNAITDVLGVEVGYTTLISGEGKLEVGKGPVRTGVTAILPRGRAAMNDPVFAGYFSLNGNGEMTGTAWVEESVGGGTGMICYEFKGGTGTASRMIPVAAVAGRGSSETKQFAIGVLVQANCGRRPQLTIRGLEVGKKIPGSVYKRETGSIIIVVATDAPLLPHQLKRLARRASLGLARSGSVSGNGSGDLFIAFSTANPHAADAKPPIRTIETMPNDLMDPLFTATVEAT